MSFHIGDYVVRTKKNTKKHIWVIVGVSDVFRDSVVCRHEDDLLHHFEVKELRLATDMEILHWKRLDRVVWYNKYCLMKTDELVAEYRRLLCRYMTLSGLVNHRSKHIKSLRSLMKYKYKSISFGW